MTNSEIVSFFEARCSPYANIVHLPSRHFVAETTSQMNQYVQDLLKAFDIYVVERLGGDKYRFEAKGDLSIPTGLPLRNIGAYVLVDAVDLKKKNKTYDIELTSADVSGDLISKLEQAGCSDIQYDGKTKIRATLTAKSVEMLNVPEIVKEIFLYSPAVLFDKYIL